MEIYNREKFISFLKDEGYVVRERRDILEFHKRKGCFFCVIRYKDTGICVNCINLLRSTEYIGYEVESEG